MIVFDLRCGGGHVFEAWFASGASFEEQVANAHVTCPICGDPSVSKAVMAPAIAAKGNRRNATVPDLNAVKAALQALASHQAKALESSQWVGTGFAEQARAMHAGDQEKSAIHGQASLAEAKALVAEGVPIAPLPLPVVPPKALN
jgi:hypothetical protein